MSTNTGMKQIDRLDDIEHVLEGLPPRKVRFLQAYLTGTDATHAAITAGYAAKSARTTGWKLLRRDKDVMKAVARTRALPPDRVCRAGGAR